LIAFAIPPPCCWPPVVDRLADAPGALMGVALLLSTHIALLSLILVSARRFYTDQS